MLLYVIFLAIFSFYVPFSLLIVLCCCNQEVTWNIMDGCWGGCDCKIMQRPLTTRSVTLGQSSSEMLIFLAQSKKFRFFVLRYRWFIIIFWHKKQELFRDCGEINAITIPVDKHTGRAKGFAYLEFADKVSFLKSLVVGEWTSENYNWQASILAALEKNNSLLRDRPIKVVNKRTNLPIWQVCTHPFNTR